MARSSQRSNRRTTSQTAAGLLTYALPAPVHRVASTRLGSKLIMVGVPAMVAAGLIHINFVDGTPKISVDRERVAELHGAAAERLKNFDTDGRLQQWERTAQDYVRANPEQFGALYNAANDRHAAGFPAPQRTTANAPGNWRFGTDAQPAPYAPAGYAPTQNYSPQNYSPQNYASPNYSTQNYPAQRYPQGAAATNSQQSAWDYQQQQLALQQQQHLAQQQLYDQQLRQQQWQAQQQPQYNTTPQTVPAPYSQSFDPYRTR